MACIGISGRLKLHWSADQDVIRYKGGKIEANASKLKVYGQEAKICTKYLYGPADWRIQ